ncbi:unnamed protein product, partial [Effrenium voratum]
PALAGGAGRAAVPPQRGAAAERLRSGLLCGRLRRLRRVAGRRGAAGGGGPQCDHQHCGSPGLCQSVGVEGGGGSLRELSGGLPGGQRAELHRGRGRLPAALGPGAP